LLIYISVISLQYYIAICNIATLQQHCFNLLYGYSSAVRHLFVYLGAEELIWTRRVMRKEKKGRSVHYRGKVCERRKEWLKVERTLMMKRPKRTGLQELSSLSTRRSSRAHSDSWETRLSPKIYRTIHLIIFYRGFRTIQILYYLFG